MRRMMGKKLKRERAITLIALVITIIVLLILAGVTIAMLTGENGILNQANEAKNKTEKATIEEKKRLSEYHDYITKEQYGAPIPEGFYYVGGTSNDGLVISDIEGDDMDNTKGGNQFVWVPVPNLNEMYGTLENGKKTGKLYTFTSTSSVPLNWSETDGMMNILDKNANREPDIVMDYDNNYNDLVKEENLQQEFDQMIQSVMIHKGFYVGRYEMSLDKNKKAQSKKGENQADAYQPDTKMWYGIYEKSKTYEKNKVKSSMLWGSQYDAMLKWMQQNNVNVASETPVEGASRNLSRATGTLEADQVNHIYDLLGNAWEWCLEAYGTSGRMNRGGSFGTSCSLSYRGESDSNISNVYHVGRLALYW